MLAWGLVTWLVIRLLRGADPRTWLLLGVVAGIGLQNKNLVVLLGICVERALITNAAGLENQESVGRVWVCTDGAAPWSQVWEELSFYG